MVDKSGIKGISDFWGGIGWRPKLRTYKVAWERVLVPLLRKYVGGTQVAVEGSLEELNFFLDILK